METTAPPPVPTPTAAPDGLQVPNITDFSLHVTVYISPSNVEPFFSYFDPVLEKVKAEPELLYFEVFQNPDDPGTITWIENWNQSTQWFVEVQLNKDYYKEYLNRTEAMFIKPREAQFWTRPRGRYIVQKAGNVE